MRFVLVLVLISGAAAAAPTPPSAQDLRDVAAGDVDAEDVVALIKVKDRLAAIRDLIRTGGTCKEVPDECRMWSANSSVDPDADNQVEYVMPGEKDSASSPCFRRWYLSTLAISLPEDELIKLSKQELRDLTKLDSIVAAEIADRLDDAQQLELASMFEQQRREPPFALTLDNAAAVKAIKRYHLAAAVPFVEPEESPEVLIGVVLDPTYPAAVRVAAIGSLETASALDQDRFVAIVRPLIADASLDVAAKAATIIGLDLKAPKTNDRALFMRFLALAATAEDTWVDTLSSYAPRGLDLVDTSGHLVEHLGPQHVTLGEDSTGTIATEIHDRMFHRAPLLGTTKRGKVILRGFIEPTEPPEQIDETATSYDPDDPDALENPNDVCSNL